MILAVGNIKGGVGKDHPRRQYRGCSGPAWPFAQIRADLPGAVKVTTVQLQGAAIRQQMRQLAEKYDEIVIDVGGRDTGSLRAALTVADVILIPFQPRSVDL